MTMNKILGCVGLMMLGALAGCGTRAGASREPDAYEGCATDEVWRTIDEVQEANQIRSDDAQAPRFLQPLAEGATLPGANPPTIEWQLSQGVAGNENGNVTCEKCPTCGTPATLVAPHEAPVTGTIFDLQFTASGGRSYRVLTSVQSLTVPAAVWQSWRGKQVSVTALRLSLQNGGLEGSAYRLAQPLSFSVGN
jgi:hypothetical protein